MVTEANTMGGPDGLRQRLRRRRRDRQEQVVAARRERRGDVGEGLLVALRVLEVELQVLALDVAGLRETLREALVDRVERGVRHDGHGADLDGRVLVLTTARQQQRGQCGSGKETAQHRGLLSVRCPTLLGGTRKK